MPTEDNILVIKLSALGDFIQALGPMAAIRKHHDNAKITLLTTAPYESFAKTCPYFDEIIIDPRPKLLDIKSWFDLKKTLNALKIKRVYDLQNNDRSSFYLKLFSPKPEWVGVAKGASHRNTSAERTAGHAFFGHKQTLELAGIKKIDIDDLSWIKADISKFNLKKPYILFVPGSSPLHPQKRWSAENYARLADYLNKMEYQIVLLGTTAEKEVTDRIKALHPSALDLNGQTSLSEIIALGRDAAACIGNDTGPMHMIAPTGCPTTVLFSSHSNAQKHYPLGPRIKVIQKDELNDLSVEEVISSIELENADKTVPKASTIH